MIYTKEILLLGYHVYAFTTKGRYTKITTMKCRTQKHHLCMLLLQECWTEGHTQHSLRMLLLFSHTDFRQISRKIYEWYHANSFDIVTYRFQTIFEGKLYCTSWKIHCIKYSHFGGSRNFGYICNFHIFMYLHIQGTMPVLFWLEDLLSSSKVVQV